MAAYEFSSVVENNGVIHIPEKYLDSISSPVKVIVFTNEDIQNNNVRKQFSAIKVKTKGFKFNRNEANGR
jgi:5S rRNA maturation endonuclease (ribonuclease M5)